MLNVFKRHLSHKEGAVARAMVQMVIDNIRSATEGAPNELLAHYFGLACAQLDFLPDEMSARRILEAVSADIRQRQRASDDLNGALVRSSKQLLDSRRGAY